MATKQTIVFMGREYKLDQLNLYSLAGDVRPPLVIVERKWEVPARRFAAMTQAELGVLIRVEASGRTRRAAVTRLETKCHARFRRLGVMLGYDVDV